MPVNKAQSVPIGFDEFGRTGLKTWSGRIHEEFLPQLSGKKAARIYNEMRRNSPVVGGALYAIEQAIRGVTWDVEPFDDSEDAKVKADFLKSNLEDMSSSWPDTLTEILTMLPHGWAMLEIVYKMRSGDTGNAQTQSKFTDNLWGWRKLSLRGQESLDKWRFDEEDGIEGMIQMAPPKFEPIFVPIEKALLFRTKTEKGNPEGWPLIRAAYRPWWFQKRIQEIEGIGVERDLAGLPMVTPPEQLSYDLWNGTDSQGIAMKATILRLIKSIRRDTHEGVLMPEGFKLELVSSGGARQFDTGAIITRYSGEILMSMLADVLQLGQAKVGTQALGKTKAQMFYSSLDGILDSATEVLNRHGATRLWRANGWPMDQMAKFTHGSATPADIEGLAEYINKLSGLITPNVTLERHLLQQANLPEAEEGLDVLDDERREDERAEREIQREINTQRLAGMNQGVLEPGEEE